VRSFYQSLAGGLPVADALRAAKLEAIRRGAKPNEWAVFTVVGDPLVTIPLRAPRSPVWPWVGGGVVVAGALYGLMRRRRMSDARGSSAPTAARTHQR
jgi:hypothetical protein